MTTRGFALHSSDITNALSLAQTPFMSYENGGYNYTIPSCLKAGYYLVRHEIIALHSAWAENGAQFYPSCHQLQVSGPGAVVPTGLVGFPGAYRAADPGLFINVWNGMFSGPRPLLCSQII